MNITRDNKGRFSKRTWLIRIGMVLALAIMIAAIWADTWTSREISVVVPEKAYAGVTMDAKVAATKSELVESLANECETKGTQEPDATIILDSNNQMSIGAFQFQIATVIQYEKVLYGRDVSRVEAIQIAVDHTRATQLATDILFKISGGWRNWQTCAKSLDLPVQIELLKKLDA